MAFSSFINVVSCAIVKLLTLPEPDPDDELEEELPLFGYVDGLVGLHAVYECDGPEHGLFLA